MLSSGGRVSTGSMASPNMPVEATNHIVILLHELKRIDWSIRVPVLRGIFQVLQSLTTQLIVVSLWASPLTYQARHTFRARAIRLLK